MPTIFNFIVLSLLLGCSTTPSGRKQFNLVGEEKMTSLGNQSFEEMKKKMKIEKSPKVNAMVVCISHRLLKSMNLKPKDWEIVVFQEKSPNAFALPGNNIGVHTGMIDLVENNDQLAAVIGHEIAHVLANHGNERVSQGLIAQGGLVVADLIIGRSSQKDQLILAGLGLGAQFGFLLPFSRKHEQEADRLGVQYMALAGFDPRQASQLWELMKQKSGGKSPPEFLSTHPSNDSRIKDLKKHAQKYLSTYQKAKQSQICQ